MAHGTILTIFNPSDEVLAGVSQILDHLGVAHELKESTYFIQVTGIGQYDAMVAALRTNGNTFTSVLLFDTTGSALRTNNIGQQDLAHLNQLLCMP